MSWLKSIGIHRFLRRSLGTLAVTLSVPLLGAGFAQAANSIDAMTQASFLVDATRHDDRPVLTIALPDTLVNPYDQFSLNETVEALRKKLRGYAIRTVIFTAAEAKEQLDRLKPDFLFAPSIFTFMTDIESVRIATRRMDTAEDAAHSVGAAIVVRANGAYQRVKDLKGAKVMTALPTAIDGWLPALATFRAEGIDPERDFASIVYRNNAYPDAISSLLAGCVDAAVVPACLIETLDREGLADVSGLRVIELESPQGVKPEHRALACRYSTALYPDISLLAMSTAPEGMVRDMTIGILSLRHTAGAEWLTNVSHASVDALMHTLQMGPYAYLKDMSPAALYARHKTVVWLVLGLIAFLVVNEIRLHRLVRRRTSALARSMAERERLAQEAEVVRMKMAGLERRSIVQQMSGMIAHEINAPVGAIRTWAAIARMKCPPDAIANHEAAAALERCLKKIDGEADRIADIVSRVRKYARRENEPAQVTSLKQILERSVRAFRAEEKATDRVTIRVDVGESPAWVYGQPLELEVLCLNLIRNAAGAMRKYDKVHQTAGGEVPTLTVQLGLLADNRRVVTVENPGPRLSPEALEHLNTKGSAIVTEAPSGEGLGLGLTICRGIADAHGASLRFEAGSMGGVKAILTMDAASKEPQNNEAMETQS